MKAEGIEERQWRHQYLNQWRNIENNVKENESYRQRK